MIQTSSEPDSRRLFDCFPSTSKFSLSFRAKITPCLNCSRCQSAVVCACPTGCFVYSCLGSTRATIHEEILKLADAGAAQARTSDLLVCTLVSVGCISIVFFLISSFANHEDSRFLQQTPEIESVELRKYLIVDDSHFVVPLRGKFSPLKGRAVPKIGPLNQIRSVGLCNTRLLLTGADAFKARIKT